MARLAERGRRPAALFVDSLFTSAGIFTPDPQVVAATLQAARDAGALLVADEVQSGHGRAGDGLWRFPAWGVTPDVVTLGKPMGNGHPIAAVVTRGELADCMAQAKTAFFSTFGGNPVACIAALTVLDVLDDERLVENAAEVGGRLRAALADLAGRHPAIGDVRGRGLMVGVELVEPGASPAPAADLARLARDGLRERGVLVGTTRREQNVLKIRPPLCITGDEAALIVSSLDEVLSALEARRDLGSFLFQPLGALDELGHAPATLAADLLEMLGRVALADRLATLLADLGEELRAVAGARGTAALATGVAHAHRLGLLKRKILFIHRPSGRTARCVPLARRRASVGLD